MAEVAHHIEVGAPAQACYDWWRPLTRLPEIMSDVRKVTARDEDERVTTWEVSGPLGSTVEWTARITDDAPPHRLAWASTGDPDNDVRTTGEVRFTDLGNGRTGVDIRFEYEPPGGKLGAAVAQIFDDPKRMVEQAAEEFKTIIETR
jgi:uncharacterized membrane protein